jgi:inner membrane transporter RhtA
MSVASIRSPSPRRRKGAGGVGLAHSAFAAGPVAGSGMLLASCTSIQIGAALARGTFAAVGPLGAAGWRFALAAAVAAVVVRPRVRSWSAARWRSVVGFGIAAAVNEVCLYEALARLPLGMAVTLEFLGPIAVALAGNRGRRQTLCAVLALGGVAAMCLSRLTADPVGIAFALAAAMGWGAYILASERAGRDSRPADSLALSLVIAALVTSPFAVAHASAATGSRTLVVLVVVAVLGTVIPYALEMAALRRLAADAVGVLFSVEPAIASLVGLVALGQGLRPVEVCGLALVVFAGANVLREPRS